MSYYQNSYSAGDTFIDYSGNKYTVVTGGNTPSTPFDSSNIVNDLIVWGDLELEPIQEGGTGQGLVDYEANKSYSVGDIVLYDDKIYRCITAHTSTSTFDDTKWEEISPSDKGLSIWGSNTAYNVDDIVIDSNLIWKCVVSHTSTTTFDESKWVCISGGEISNGLEIITLWEGSYSFSNTNPIELNEPITNFEYLRLFTELHSSTKDEQGSGLIYVPYILASGSAVRITGMSSNSAYASVDVSMSDSTHIYLHDTSFSSNWPYSYVTRIEGIRKSKPIVSSGMKYETLYEGEAGSLSGSGSTTISLSDNVSKYQKIGFTIKTKPGNESVLYYREIDVDNYIKFIDGTLSVDHIGFYEGYSDFNDYVEINTGSTSTQVVFSYGKSLLIKVVGISEGVVVPTGLQAARVILWEGTGNTINQVLNLADNYTNYDYIIMYLYDSLNNSAIAQTIMEPKDTSVANVSYVHFYDNVWATAIGVVQFSSNTCTISIFGVTNMSGIYLSRIEGIKLIQPDSYSTDEQLIGTWVDGKPLYRKVFTNVTSPFNSGLTSSNSSVKRLYGYAKDGGDTSYLLPLPYADSQAQNYTVSLNYTSTTGNISVYGWRNGSNYSIIIDSIIVEYTKN